MTFQNPSNLQPHENILNNHHIIRYLKPKQFEIDPITNEIVVMLDGFFPRAQDQSLSVNWCEFYGEDRAIQIEALREAPGLPYDKKGRGQLAVFKVETVKTKLKKLSEDGFQPNVIYTPTANTPSHASIINIPLLSAEVTILKRFNLCYAKLFLILSPPSRKPSNALSLLCHQRYSSERQPPL
jgi:hypothetical protein